MSERNPGQPTTKIPIVARVENFLEQRRICKREKDRLKALTRVSPLRLVIGASGYHDPGWIATDREYLNLLNRRHWKAYFKKNSIDAILAEHVWEHLTTDEGFVSAGHCFEFLKPGGYLRVAVPDGFSPDQDYIDYVKPGGTGAGSEDHKILYNYLSLSDIFSRAGFRVKLLEYYDAKGDFHFEDWSPEEGKIRRSKRFDQRNRGGKLNYTSIILDAYKNQ